MTNKYSGTQTEKNLQAALAGESEARNKYTWFASKAKKDGFEQIAEIFLKTADNEKEHAKLWYKELTGGVGSTAENLAAAAEGGETLGGVIECVSVGVPAGIGSPIFDGLENTIAQLIFSIPGVKGLEFGAGFDVARMVGSQNNDSFYVDEHGYVKTMSNNHGGILGGISSGMPIALKVAVKPNSSIGAVQDTVNLSTLEGGKLAAEGSRQACTIPGLVPCVEACVNLALLTHMLDYPHFTG